MTRMLVALILLTQGLASLGTISGRILLPDGALATNVSVGLVALEANSATTTSAAFLRATQTDSAGSFRIIGITPGRYYLVAGPPSAPTYYPGTTTRANAEIIEVSAGPSAKDGMDIRDFTGRTTFSISGRFVPPPQSPMTLQINLGGGKMAQSAVSPDGSFEFSGVPSGTRNIELQRPLGTGVIGTPPVTFGGFRLTDDVSGLVILSGRVTVDDSSAVPVSSSAGGLAFAVEAYDDISIGGAPATRATRSTIQPDGSFTLFLTEGQHRIRLVNVPGAYNVRSISSGSIDLLSTPLNVSSTAPLTEIRSSLGKAVLSGVKVSGTVRGLPGTIASTGIVYMQEVVPGNRTGGLFQTSPRLNGTFEFSPVPPGIYSVLVSGINVGGPQTAVLDPQVWWIGVGNQDIRDLEFPGFIVPGFLDGPLGTTAATNNTLRISGRISVVDENGAAYGLPDGIMIRFSGSPPSLTAIRPDGTFTAPVSNGDHRVAFTGIPLGYGIRAMTWGAINLMNTPLVIDGSAMPIEEVQVILEFNRRDATEGRQRLVNGTISGRLLNSNGSPTGNAQVHAAISVIGPSVASAVTDKVGAFRLENLPPGKYVIIVGSNPNMPTPSRIVNPGGAQISPSDPAFQVSIGYGTNAEIGTAIAELVAVNANRTATFYRIQATR